MERTGSSACQAFHQQEGADGDPQGAAGPGDDPDGGGPTLQDPAFKTTNTLDEDGATQWELNVEFSAGTGYKARLVLDDVLIGGSSLLRAWT